MCSDFGQSDEPPDDSPLESDNCGPLGSVLEKQRLEAALRELETNKAALRLAKRRRSAAIKHQEAASRQSEQQELPPPAGEKLSTSTRRRHRRWFFRRRDVLKSVECARSLASSECSRWSCSDSSEPSSKVSDDILDQEVRGCRSQVWASVKKIEELQGVVNPSSLEAIDLEELSRSTRLQKALISAVVVDLWLWDSERLQGKLATSVLEHPAGILCEIAADPSILSRGGEYAHRALQDREISVAYRSLAVLSELLCTCTKCPQATGRHLCHYVDPIEDSFEDVLEVSYGDETRKCFRKLVQSLEPRWSELQKGAERYRCLVELCEQEEIVYLTEEAKRRRMGNKLESRRLRRANAKHDSPTDEPASPQTCATLPSFSGIHGTSPRRFSEMIPYKQNV